MKTIKLKFVGFWNGFDWKTWFLTRYIERHYNNIEISDNPDYIFCSCGPKNDPYAYCKYDQPRIFYSGENYIPDMNLVDYAISSYTNILFDRCLSIPVGFNRFVDVTTRPRELFTLEMVKEKEYFCNFIFSHDSEYNERSEFFELLSKYKHIESLGPLLYNRQDGIKVQVGSWNKTDFQRKCKFTICFESTIHKGFISEKIADAFYADTIPIYMGSDTITDIFNEKAFIYIKSKSDFESAIQKIIDLDNDDEKYLEMLKLPIYKNNYVSEKEEEIEKFLRNIFDPPKEKSYKRSRVYLAKRFNDYFLGNLQAVTDQGESIVANNISVDYQLVKFEKGTVMAFFWKIKRLMKLFKDIVGGI